MKTIRYALLLTTASISMAFAGDYLIWPNGRGRVHKHAGVSPSAFIRDSEIGPNVTIGENAVIVSSAVGLANTDKALTIGARAIVKESTINGGVDLMEDTVVVSTNLLGGGQLSTGAWVRESTITGSIMMGESSFVDNTDVTESALLGKRSWILNTQITGATLAPYCAFMDDQLLCSEDPSPTGPRDYRSKRRPLVLFQPNMHD